MANALAFAFGVQTVKAQGALIYIFYDGTIDGTTDIQTSDKITYYFTNNINGSIYVERDDIVMDGSGYTLQGSGTGIGIDTMFGGIENLTIRNLHVKNFETGIMVGSDFYGGSSFPTHYNISGNIIENNTYGIRIYYYSGINVNGNNIANNRYGICIESSVNNTINANDISTNHDSGIQLYYCSNNNITANNLTANSYSGILLDDSTDNSISENIFISNGLHLWNSDHNSVEDNIVNDRPLVYLEDVSNYSVAEAGQVILVNCDNIRVENLNLSKATTGLELCWTNNSIIFSNNMSTNGLWGIYMYSSSNNSVTGNNVADNLRGIWLDFASSYNVITGNNITRNTQNGLIIINDSFYNMVYFNNFIDNLMRQVYTMDLPNSFDDGSHGNYWSDYSGADANHDCIGDTPYVIDANNTDNYPLMTLYIIPEFPSFLILPLSVIGAMLAVIAYRRNHLRRTTKSLKSTSRALDRIRKTQFLT